MIGVEKPGTFPDFDVFDYTLVIRLYMPMHILTLTSARAGLAYPLLHVPTECVLAPESMVVLMTYCKEFT